MGGKKKPVGRGRRSKYETHVLPKLKMIEHWCRDGLMEEEICKRLGVGVSTFNRYKNDYRELREVLRLGKEEADYEVEESLFKRALGYRYDEVTKERIFVEELGAYEMVTTKVVTKQVSPDVTAQIFWLKNRKKEIWRDKHEVKNEHTGKDGEPLQVLFNISRPKPNTGDSYDDV